MFSFDVRDRGKGFATEANAPEWEPDDEEDEEGAEAGGGAPADEEPSQE